MKKFVTFSNFMVLLGIMTILFYFIPAVTVSVTGQYTASVNLFKVTFGGPFRIDYHYPDFGAYSLLPCGGLITGFFLGIVGIVLTFLKSKNKLANLLAFPFYVAAGVLVSCTGNLVTAVNFDVVPNCTYSLLGGTITVATFWCILAFFALVDFIASIARPKPQNPAY